jgi:hypothetical protein
MSSYRCRSEPQMPDEVTRMTTSVGSSMRGSGTVSMRTSRLPCQVSAFNVASLSRCSLGQALAVRDQVKRATAGPSRSFTVA